MAEPLRTGLMRLLDGERTDLRGARAALLTHPGAVLPDLTGAAEALARSPEVDLVALLGPEHGVRGSAPAGATEQSSVDELTGLPVIETYGAPVDAVAERLAAGAVEVLLVDLQDVGCRCYTYPSTLRDAIRAATSVGVRIVVLDRPNPVGGAVASGPPLQDGYDSFVGAAPVRLRHGMTIGELAALLAEEGRIDVVPLAGWQRGERWTTTGLPWVPPSPNLPTTDAVSCYPGTVLVEGTNLSEGRGTPTPFTFVGAPWVDGRLGQAIRGLDLPGVLVRDTSVVPTAGKHAGSRCRGLALHVTDGAGFDPVATAVAVIATARLLYPGDFGWSGDPDDRGRRFIDKLAGGPLLRRAVDDGADAAELAARFSAPATPSGPLLYS